MSSGDCASHVDDKLQDNLTVLQTLLSRLYHVISLENEKQKSLLARLSRLHCWTLEMRKSERKVPDVSDNAAAEPADVERLSMLLAPELAESETILNRCKNLKTKFKSTRNVSRAPVSGRVSQEERQRAKTVNKPGQQVREQDSAPGLCSVVSQKKLKQLNKLLRPEETPFVIATLPTSDCGSDTSARSLQKLVEENRALEDRLRRHLGGKPPQSSLLFLEKMNSSMSSESILVDDKGTVHSLSTERSIPYSSVADVLSMCSRISKVQFSEFYSQLCGFLKNNIFPLLDKCHSAKGIPATSVLLLQSLTKPDHSEEDHENVC